MINTELPFERLCLQLWRHKDCSVDCEFGFVQNTKTFAYKSLGKVQAMKKAKMNYRTDQNKMIKKFIIQVLEKIELGEFTEPKTFIREFTYTRR